MDDIPSPRTSAEKSIKAFSPNGGYIELATSVSLHDRLARDRPDLGLIAGDKESVKRWFESFGIEFV